MNGNPGSEFVSVQSSAGCIPFAKQEHSYAWFHSMAFAPDLRPAKDREYCIHFFLKIEGKIITHLAENWDPHQVSVKDVMSETKDRCFALFRVSEKFPWHGSERGLVVIIIPETHAPFLWKERYFHYTLQSVFLHLIS